MIILADEGKYLNICFYAQQIACKEHIVFNYGIPLKWPIQAIFRRAFLLKSRVMPLF